MRRSFDSLLLARSGRVRLVVLPFDSVPTLPLREGNAIDSGSRFYFATFLQIRFEAGLAVQGEKAFADGGHRRRPVEEIELAIDRRP